MTAVVGILNKQAVAIAADSAVTITGSNGRKIFNKANKVFTLSKYHPVGIMIYNSATFMGVPWEIIIKSYRKQLGEKDFDTVKLYQEDFISYLRSKDFFTDINQEKNVVNNFVATLINWMFTKVFSDNKDLVESDLEEIQNRLLSKLEEIIDNYIKTFDDPLKHCSEFIDYSFEEFESYIDEFLTGYLNNIQTDKFRLNDALRQKLKTLAFLYLKTIETFSSYTGLIFTGFGDKEIFPTLIPINVSFSVGKRLRYYVVEREMATISVSQEGAICPFAQKDVIDTILQGVDPSLDSQYLANFSEMLTKYNQEILSHIGDSDPVLTAQIKSIDVPTLVNKYAELNNSIKYTNYISPLMNAVSNLDKEDLAEMAESMIYLTYLKRRITFSEESVGGPVDVAIISKGDGFIWIKRKHYFQPQLNQFFFDNYYKS